MIFCGIICMTKLKRNQRAHSEVGILVKFRKELFECNALIADKFIKKSKILKSSFSSDKMTELIRLNYRKKIK
jgi:hypothetical protein